MKYCIVRLIGLVLALALGASSASASISGQAPTANDDEYMTDTGENLSVDDPGVLLNDTDPEGDPLTAVLVSSAGASGVLILFEDGSFEYEVAPGFIGTDTFTYSAFDGTQNSAPATVTFTVNQGSINTPVGFTDRPTFLSVIASQGWTTLVESYEDPVWPRSPITAMSVSSMGVTWTGNNPTSGITTGPGPAIAGQYGFFELPHGDYVTGTNCNTPGNCTDGWIASAETGKFVAAGMWIHCNAGQAGIEFILDGDTANPVDFGGFGLSAGSTRFYGVVSSTGFQTFEVHETEGKAEDASFIFADVFTFAVEPVPTVQAYGCGVNPADSLTVVSGLPQLGTTLTLGIDNPLGTQSIGSRAYLILAIAPAPGYPCGQLLPGLGMSGPGASGEYLLSVAPPNPVFKKLGPAWMGPGSPVSMSLPIPDDMTLSGITIYAQAALLDIFPGASIPIGLTGGLELLLAP